MNTSFSELLYGDEKVAEENELKNRRSAVFINPVVESYNDPELL